MSQPVTTPPAGDPPAPAGQQPAPAASTTSSVVVPGAQTPPPPPATTDDDDVLTAGEAAKLRRESAQLRRRLGELEAEREREAQAKLTEDERRAKAATDRETAIEQRELVARERLTTAAIKEAAASAGVTGAKLALLPRLIDRADVEYDKDGDPTNVGELVKALLKDYPDFLGPAPAQPAVRGDVGAGGRGVPTGLTIDAIKKMTPQEINSRWDEVSAALRTQGH